MTPAPYLLHRIFGALLLVCVALLLSAGPAQAWREAYELSMDWIWEVEDTLQEAAAKTPNRHELRLSIERHVHDIVYFLHRSAKAARVSDHAAAEEHARQAVSLLQRGVRKGFFRQSDFDEVMAIIKQHLPDVEV